MLLIAFTVKPEKGRRGDEESREFLPERPTRVTRETVRIQWLLSALTITDDAPAVCATDSRCELTSNTVTERNLRYC